jgi:uncharacterized protein (DUF1800 family)
MRALTTMLLIPISLGVLGACDLGNRTRYHEHILNRIGYGGDAWSRARINEIGANAYIDEQLSPAALDDTALEAEIASLYPVMAETFGVSRSTHHEYTGNSQTGPYVPIRDATRTKILRSVKSKKQLEQVLVDFWYNHFNVDGIVEEARWGFLTMERDAIRPYVFGSFETMLRKVAENPGMLDYLDNSLNFKDGFLYLGLERGINENFARELLELHTLGVDGGYTHEDIIEVARAFTGWTLATNLFFYPTGYFFHSGGHDRDAKSLFGGALELPANRNEPDGRDVIHYLATHPNTAERVARKLCQRFISEAAPPPAVIEAAKQTFLATTGDLRATTRAVLFSEPFRAFTHEDEKVKRPLHFLASLARSVGVSPNSNLFAERMDSRLQWMGEHLYRAGPPTGYPESSAYWSGEGGIVQRVSLASDAANGLHGFTAVPNTVATTPSGIVDELVARYIRTGIEPTTRQALIDLATSLPPAARVSQVAATLFVSPDFLLH